MEIDALRNQYQAEAVRANRLRAYLCEEIEQLLIAREIALGVPIESRVKAWASLQEKLERKAIEPERLSDLDDLVGIRLILLFSRDLETVGRMLTETFDIITVEDTSTRLAETQFGYQSVHYVLRLPQAWLKVPTFADLGTLRAEIQVRTLAQHIWAAASHKLQYKQEESVPVPVRRSIHRVSALLETVDLEFERVLEERARYIERATDAPKPNEPLNVDLLASILSELLPAQNKVEYEPYADLLSDLARFNITTADDLRGVIHRRLVDALKDEAMEVERRGTTKDVAGTSEARIGGGVFFTHVGLARQILRVEFDEQFEDYIRAISKERQQARSSSGSVQRGRSKPG